MNGTIKATVLAAALLGTALFGTTGCGAVQAYPAGFVYTGTNTPHGMSRANVDGDGKTGALSGKSCATGILGMAAWGDASIDAAKKNGTITSVHSVEFDNFAILGMMYQKSCTVVHGS